MQIYFKLIFICVRAYVRQRRLHDGLTKALILDFHFFYSSLICVIHLIALCTVQSRKWEQINFQMNEFQLISFHSIRIEWNSEIRAFAIVDATMPRERERESQGERDRNRIEQTSNAVMNSYDFSEKNFHWPHNTHTRSTCPCEQINHERRTEQPKRWEATENKKLSDWVELRHDGGRRLGDPKQWNSELSIGIRIVENTQLTQMCSRYSLLSGGSLCFRPLFTHFDHK